MGEEDERPRRRAPRSQARDGEAAGSSGTEEKQATAPRRWIEGRMSANLNFLRIIGGLAAVQDPAGLPAATGQGPCVVQGSSPPGQTLEAEDEFERGRR